MNDCFWCVVGVCDGNGCGACKKYIGRNSVVGKIMVEAYDEEIRKVLDPLLEQYDKATEKALSKVKKKYKEYLEGLNHEGNKV